MMAALQCLQVKDGPSPGRIPHQLVFCLLEPVHEFRVAGGPIIRGHSAAFLWDLGMPELTQRYGVWQEPAGTGCVTQMVRRVKTNVLKPP